MLFTQAIPQKRTFILSVTQKIPPESLTNTGRIFNIENAKNILSNEIGKQNCCEELVWIGSIAVQMHTTDGKNKAGT